MKADVNSAKQTQPHENAYVKHDCEFLQSLQHSLVLKILSEI